jgi:hypothetical protein
VALQINETRLYTNLPIPGTHITCINQGALQLHRAVGRILDAEKTSIVNIMERAVRMNAKTTTLDSELAKAFQYTTRCERGDRIFLEVCFWG